MDFTLEVASTVGTVSRYVLNWRIFISLLSGCQVDYSNSPDSLRILSLAWWYFFSKFVDLLDTFFFVARYTYMKTKVYFERCNILSFMKEEVQPCVGFARDPS